MKHEIYSLNKSYIAYTIYRRCRPTPLLQRLTGLSELPGSCQHNIQREAVPALGRGLSACSRLVRNHIRRAWLGLGRELLSESRYLAILLVLHHGPKPALGAMQHLEMLREQRYFLFKAIFLEPTCSFAYFFYSNNNIYTIIITKNFRSKMNNITQQCNWSSCQRITP